MSQEEAKSKYVEYFLQFLDKNPTEEGAKHKSTVSSVFDSVEQSALADAQSCWSIRSSRLLESVVSLSLLLSLQYPSQFNESYSRSSPRKRPCTARVRARSYIERIMIHITMGGGRQARITL